MEVPVLTTTRWWWCRDCDQRAKEEGATAEHPVLSHPCPKWGGLDVPFWLVDGPDGVISGEHRPILGDRDRIDAMQTMHTDGSWDVTVFGETAGSAAGAPPPD